MAGGAAAVAAAVALTRRDPDQVRWPTDPPPPLAVVLGGGALFGTAWHIAVMFELRDAGVDLTDVPLVGTSAGSWVAAAVRLGVPLEALYDLPMHGRPDRRPGFLASFAREIFGDAPIPGVTVCALEATALRRRLLDGAEHPAADLVAASSAIPGVFAPHRVGGRLYVDGGLRSPCSVAVLPAAEHLVVSLPLRGIVSPAAGRAAAAASRRSVEAWRRRHGGTVIELSPPPVLDGIARLSLRDALSTAAALEALPALRAAAGEVIGPHAATLRAAARRATGRP